MKWFKFGFTREWDNLSTEIRKGNKKRAHAIAFIKKNKFKLPSKEIKLFCDYLSITRKEFFNIV